MDSLELMKRKYNHKRKTYIDNNNEKKLSSLLIMQQWLTLQQKDYSLGGVNHTQLPSH